VEEYFNSSHEYEMFKLTSQNGVAQKDKWYSIANELKKIYIYIACTWHNQDYETMSIQRKNQYLSSL
jgi:hypothetical protein